MVLSAANGHKIRSLQSLHLDNYCKSKIYYTANVHQHKPLGDLVRERPVCLKAEADKCSDNDGGIYVFFWLWSFLRTSIGVGWSMDFPVSVKTFLVES